ncbi:hypothetical protein HDV00_007307 [Rhizophlyctis rosea]|nr:hypothetical protein HDV00_007307 [Rhizophlyctis rosea]
MINGGVNKPIPNLPSSAPAASTTPTASPSLTPAPHDAHPTLPPDTTSNPVSPLPILPQTNTPPHPPKKRITPTLLTTTTCNPNNPAFAPPPTRKRDVLTDWIDRKDHAVQLNDYRPVGLAVDKGQDGGGEEFVEGDASEDESDGEREREGDGKGSVKGVGNGDVHFVVEDDTGEDEGEWEGERDWMGELAAEYGEVLMGEGEGTNGDRNPGVGDGARNDAGEAEKNAVRTEVEVIQPRREDFDDERDGHSPFVSDGSFLFNQSSVYSGGGDDEVHGRWGQEGSGEVEAVPNARDVNAADTAHAADGDLADHLRIFEKQASEVIRKHKMFKKKGMQVEVVIPVGKGGPRSSHGRVGELPSPDAVEAWEF